MKPDYQIKLILHDAKGSVSVFIVGKQASTNSQSIYILLCRCSLFHIVMKYCQQIKKKKNITVIKSLGGQSLRRRNPLGVNICKRTAALIYRTMWSLIAFGFGTILFIYLFSNDWISHKSSEALLLTNLRDFYWKKLPELPPKHFMGASLRPFVWMCWK